MHAHHRVYLLTCYTASCIGLYGLLNLYYYDTCKSSWFSYFGIDSSPYCGLIRKALTTLQFSPLIVTGFWRHLRPDEEE